jgi:HEAT repeat protein
MMILLQTAAALMVMGSPLPVHPRQAQSVDRVEYQGDPADSLYKAARKARDANDLRKAATIYQQLVDKYPKSQYAGDALYWRAWSLWKTGVARRSKSDLDDALTALNRQQTAYPNASMSADAKDLKGWITADEARLGDPDAAKAISSTAQELGTRGGCPSDDDDMRMAALNGLLQTDAESALPILKAVLAKRGACTEQLRKTAVFILSQKRADEATTMLLDAARNDPSPDVRKDAVQWLGQTRSERAAVALDSILFSAGDTEIRNAAIFALSQQRSTRAGDALRRAATDEKLPSEVRGQAVFWLGQSRLADMAFYRDLFKKSTNDEVRNQILMAVSQMRSPDASAWLLELARDKTLDDDSRKNAIFQASQQRAVDLDGLAKLYDDSKGEEEIQKQILFVYSQRREPAALDKLMAVARTDPNKELKKQAIFWIGQKAKYDPRAQAFLLEILK